MWLVGCAGAVSSHSRHPALLVLGYIHVDADGGCGLVCRPYPSVHQEAETIHIGFHAV